MAIGSGVGGFAAFGAESTFATYVAPSRFLELTSAEPKANKNTQQGTGLAAGQLVDRAARRVVTTRDAAGSVKLDVTANGHGLLLAQALGSTATPVQVGATTAYTQTHVLGDTRGLSMSMQLGIPDLAGTLHPYSFLGTKISSATWECQKDGFLTAEYDVDSQTETEAQTLVTPAFVNSDSFHFGLMNVKVGATYGSETTIEGVTGLNLKLDRPLDVGRFYADGTGLKSEQIMNGRAKLTGTITADYVNKADLADRFASDVTFSLVWTFVGPQIGTSGSFETITFTLPACKIDSDPPVLSNLDVVSTGYGFTALYDGTHPALTITYLSSDTAV